MGTTEKIQAIVGKSPETIGLEDCCFALQVGLMQIMKQHFAKNLLCAQVWEDKEIVSQSQDGQPSSLRLGYCWIDGATPADAWGVFEDAVNAAMPPEIFKQHFEMNGPTVATQAPLWTVWHGNIQNRAGYGIVDFRICRLHDFRTIKAVSSLIDFSCYPEMMKDEFWDFVQVGEESRAPEPFLKWVPLLPPTIARASSGELEDCLPLPARLADFDYEDFQIEHVNHGSDFVFRFLTELLINIDFDAPEFNEGNFGAKSFGLGDLVRVDSLGLIDNKQVFRMSHPLSQLAETLLLCGGWQKGLPIRSQNQRGDEICYWAEVPGITIEKAFGAAGVIDLKRVPSEELGLRLATAMIKRLWRKSVETDSSASMLLRNFHDYLLGVVPEDFEPGCRRMLRFVTVQEFEHLVEILAAIDSKFRKAENRPWDLQEDIGCVLPNDRTENLFLTKPVICMATKCRGAMPQDFAWDLPGVQPTDSLECAIEGSEEQKMKFAGRVSRSLKDLMVSAYFLSQRVVK